MPAVLRIALLAAWVASMASFGAFAVYRAFQVLPTYLAAEFLRGGFDGLDRMGILGGIACTLLGWGDARRRARLAHWIRVLLPLGASASHALSYLWLTPEIVALRQAAGGTVGQLASGDPAVARFEFLHETSRTLYVAAVLLILFCCSWDIVSLRLAAGADAAGRR